MIKNYKNFEEAEANSNSEIVKISIDKTLKKKIEQWKSEKRYFSLLPIKGDSMTCNGNKSIPNESRVLVSETNYSFNPQKITKSYHTNIYNPNIFNIPIGRPVVILIRQNNEDSLFCKEINFIDEPNNMVYLTSYNPKYPQQKTSLSSIKKVFEVHKVIKGVS